MRAKWHHDVGVTLGSDIAPADFAALLNGPFRSPRPPEEYGEGFRYIRGFYNSPAFGARGRRRVLIFQLFQSPEMTTTVHD